MKTSGEDCPANTVQRPPRDEHATVWHPKFESDPAVIYALDHGFRIVHCNKAWDRFALENNGESVVRSQVLGTCLWDVIPPSLQPFYRNALHGVAETGLEWLHLFECSSPTVHRRLHMRLLPFGTGFLTVISTVSETAPPPPEKGTEEFPRSGQIVTLCSHCRRSRNVADDSWLWMPQLIANLPKRISHGLCPVCFAYHYPGAGRTEEPVEGYNMYQVVSGKEGEGLRHPTL